MTSPPVRAPNEDLIDRFIVEYVKDFKGGAAARRAGVTESSARSWASRMIVRPEVAEKIAKLKTEHLQQRKAEVADLIDRLTRIALIDMSELVEFRRCCCRHCWGKAFGYQRTDNELRGARARHGKEMRKAKLEGRDLTEELEAFDEQGGGGFNATSDPNPECPECFGEGVGMPFLKDTRELGPDALAAFAGVKVTKEGIEVKTHDPMRAIELLGRHLDMFTENVNVKGGITLTQLAGRMRKRAPLA